MSAEIRNTLKVDCKEQFVSQRNDQKLNQLVSLIFPLTNPSIDARGNTIQLWSIPKAKIIGTVQKPDGCINYIPPSLIQNALNPQENTTTLHNRLLLSPRSVWNLVLKESGELQIWPHLVASGWKDAIPRSNGDMSKLGKLARGKTQGQMCAWFYANGYKVTEANRTRVDVHHNGKYIGTFDPIKQGHNIRNFLMSQRGASVSLTLSSDPPSKAEKNFAGRGLVFQHPKDRSQATFNIDCSQVNGGKREGEGGYHIDVRSPFLPKAKN